LDRFFVIYFLQQNEYPANKNLGFFNKPAEGADRVACSALSPLKACWCGKLS